MKLLSVVALFGLFAFAPLPSQTAQAYQINLSIDNYPDNPFPLTQTSNSNFTALSTLTLDFNHNNALMWQWVNESPSAENTILHALTGERISGSYTSVTYERLTINADGLLTYAINAQGLSYQSIAISSIVWGTHLSSTDLFPSSAVTLSNFLSTLVGTQLYGERIIFSLADRPAITPIVQGVTVAPALTVPEPTSIALIGGVGALLLWRRRSFRRRAN